jgi:beta-glucosidase
VSQLTHESAAIERLGIPAYNWWNECLHGVARAGIATVFPQAIGMAAMWDDSMMYRIGTAISDEARAKHHRFLKEGKRGIYQGLTYWTPNINIFRDPRWGRGMETYGEDPYLTGELAVQFIKGLQGDDPKYLKLVATAKHFVVHSGPESSRHSFNAVPSSYDFLETYTPHFKKAIQKANVYSVMCAYNSYNGMPCCANTELERLMRNEWGFQGYIVSDCWAIADFYKENTHEIVNTKAEAAALGVLAGTDLNCGNSYPALVDAVAQGYITEEAINRSLKRLLVARMKLGMFDPEEKVPFSTIPYSVVDSKEHQALALETARKTMVLLKNDNNTLPFSKNIKNVAVIGPNANDVDVMLGNYNGYPSNPMTPLAGIRAKLPNATVNFALGCPLAEELPILVPVSKQVLYTDNARTTSGLKGEYFNNAGFKGEPLMVRNDENIDFTWWTQSPGGGINPDTFSVRWTGVLIPEKTGNYAIGGEGYKSIKLTFDGKEVVKWDSQHHSAKKYKTMHLQEGKAYAVSLEYIQEKTEYAHVRFYWEEPRKNLKQEALAIAKNADVIVLCMGLSPLLEGEEMEVEVAGFAGGDRVDIKLPQSQTDLIKAMYALGKPTVLVLMNGSALAFNWEAKNLPAILEAWYPGQAGGAAIADILFGDYNPSGRLPVTFYQSVEQLPAFDDYSMQGRTYRYFSGEPLYEFGYGLSYTNFNYSNLVIPDELEAGETLTLTVNVTNVGKMAGDEVLQLYLSHPDCSYKTAIRSLKGFKRISLMPGETKTVTFSILPEDMAVLNEMNQYVITAGELSLSVGGQQPCEKSIHCGKVLTNSTMIKVSNGDFFPINKIQ